MVVVLQRVGEGGEPRDKYEFAANVFGEARHTYRRGGKAVFGYDSAVF